MVLKSYLGQDKEKKLVDLLLNFAKWDFERLIKTDILQIALTVAPLSRKQQRK